MQPAPPPVEVVAHRGASIDAPEHTLAAYDLALVQGADALELDLRATADGELVVVHDRTLWRTAGDPRAVDSLTTADLADLPDAARPLTLAAVLDRYADRTRLVLDLKDPAPPMEHRLVGCLERRGLRSDVVLQSFDLAALVRIRALDRRLPIAPLSERVPRRRGDWLDRISALGAVGIGVHHTAVDAPLVAAAHARGLAVRAWTVNGAAEASRLAAINVDGVITDAPGEMRACTATRHGARALAA